jgi:hypothetical protein
LIERFQMITPRSSERLEIVDAFYPDYDAVTRPLNPEAEAAGTSNCDLRCGKDGELLLRNFTVEEAQNQFRMENKRVVIKCPACGSYNLLAAAVEKSPQGEIVTLPHRK